MVMVKDPNGVPYSMDGYLHRSFSTAKEVMRKKDLDLPILVSGYPGTGKSTLVMQIATFVDPTFNEDRMCVDTQSFVEQIQIAKKKQAVVLDESFEGLNASEIRKEMGRVLSNMLNVVRQKNLYIFLIIPNFFDMAKSLAVFRTRWLLHCYSKHFGDIGQFVAFDRPTKHTLYMKGKRDNNYNVVKGDFFGSFAKPVPTQINYKKYLKKKEEGLKNIFLETEKNSKVKDQRDHAIIYMKEQLQYDVPKIAGIIKVTTRTIYNTITSHERNIPAM